MSTPTEDTIIVRKITEQDHLIFIRKAGKLYQMLKVDGGEYVEQEIEDIEEVVNSHMAAKIQDSQPLTIDTQDENGSPTEHLSSPSSPSPRPDEIEDDIQPSQIPLSREQEQEPQSTQSLNENEESLSLTVEMDTDGGETSIDREKNQENDGEGEGEGMEGEQMPSGMTTEEKIRYDDFHIHLNKILAENFRK